MKINILTFHCAENYGAVLQAFALQETLKQYSKDVEIIDYQPWYLLEPYKLIRTNTYKTLISSMYNLPTNMLKKYKFNSFTEKNIVLSENKYTSTKKNIEINPDILFIGSDQVWNSEITKNDPCYWGEISSNVEYICATYAASIGADTISENDKFFIQKHIENFDAIAVREKSAKKVLNEYSNDIDIVLDPTLLLDKKKWNELIKNNNRHKERYVLLYTLCGYEDTIELAEKVASKYGYTLIELSAYGKSIRKKPKHKQLYSQGPREFIDLIRNAEYIVTDSFHGTAFSIIFNKHFFTIPHKTRGGRMRDLLGTINLTDRLVEDIHNVPLEDNIDYNDANKALERERRKSLLYIESVMAMARRK